MQELHTYASRPRGNTYPTSLPLVSGNAYLTSRPLVSGNTYLTALLLVSVRLHAKVMKTKITFHPVYKLRFPLLTPQARSGGGLQAQRSAHLDEGGAGARDHTAQGQRRASSYPWYWGDLDATSDMWIAWVRLLGSRYCVAA